MFGGVSFTHAANLSTQIRSFATILTRNFGSTTSQVKTLAFDMYGTTFDVQGLGHMMQSMPAIGDEKELAFNSMWRQKQLEYTFRRTCMNQYLPMTICTRNALDYCCDMFDAPLSEEQRALLWNAYVLLPSFPDCQPGLQTLKKHGHRCFAFSNGTNADIRSLIKSAKLEDSFDGIVVVDNMDTPVFKPHPNTYNYFTQTAGSEPAETWLVSSNPFDIIGAGACGWKTAWMKRGGKPNYVMDIWPDAPSPTIVVENFNELPEALADHS